MCLARDDMGCVCLGQSVSGPVLQLNVEDLDKPTRQVVRTCISRSVMNGLNDQAHQSAHLPVCILSNRMHAYTSTCTGMHPTCLLFRPNVQYLDQRMRQVLTEDLLFTSPTT